MKMALGFLVLVCTMGSPAFASGGMEGGGVPNPSVRLCRNLGGTGVTIDQGSWGGSQTGLCRLADDSRIEEWTLFSVVRAIQGGRPGDMPLVVRAFLSSSWTTYPGPIESWAEQHCHSMGGSISGYVEHLRPDVRHSICRFPDGSGIEAWTLAHGPGTYWRLAELFRGQH